MKLTVNDVLSSYDIVVEKGILSKVNDYLNVDKKVLIVSDSNIPSSYYLDTFKDFNNLFIVIIKAGEKSKNYKNYLKVVDTLIKNHFANDDYIVTVGGGVVGDLGGFVASTFKRGMKWINIPTSTIAIIDSSIGGKVAIDYKGVKNALGNFYNPELVLIDFDVLQTLPQRQFYNGLFEALKIGYLYNKSIIDDIENDIFVNLENIIVKSLKAKIMIVEKDFYCKNLRHQLNFGHTFGHALESYFKFSSKLYHGEAIGYGMRYVVSRKLLSSLDKHLELLHLPSIPEVSKDKLFKFIMDDKKIKNNKIRLITLSEVNVIKEKYVSIEKL